MAVYTTRSIVKTHLGLGDSDTSLDALIDLLLEEVDAVIDGFTGRGSLASAAATEYMDGSGREMLLLRRRPVTAVAGVWVDGGGHYGQGDGAFGDATEWNVGVDFAIPRTDATEENGGMLVAIGAPDFGAGGVWPAGRGNVKVTYTAGYSTIPKDLQLAATNLVAQLINGSEKGALLAGETIGDYSYRLLSDPEAAGGGVASLVIGTVRSTLARYREVSA